MRAFLLITILFSTTSFGNEVKYSASYWDDLKDSVSLLLKGSYTQFTTKSNLVYGALAIPANWYAFDHDDRLAALSASKDIKKYQDIIGDLGVVLSFPVVPLAAYFWGRNTNKKKHIEFAKEYASAMYLALFEAGVISYIHVHNRPDTTELSFWEKAFRDESSFPSGHVVPYAMLMFKTFQFYGPYWLLPTSALFYFASFQRMQDRKHYFSDIVGAFFLSAFASEGIRKANAYKNNHKVYKWIFEHDVQIGYLRKNGGSGLLLSFSYE